MQKIYLVKCKFCGNKQKKITNKTFPLGLRKICVYCGKTFVIHNGPKDSHIIKEIEIKQKTLI
jgi:nitrous oxide reductase accessory protein NosL